MQTEDTLSSKNPYLLRALYDWIVDNDGTPFLSVDADVEGVAVPRQFVQDGRIVLDLSPNAIRMLRLGDDAVEFDARFGGRPFHIYIPIPAIEAIFLKETGEGMAFEPDHPVAPPPEQKPQGGHLHIVRDDEA